MDWQKNAYFCYAFGSGAKDARGGSCTMDATMPQDGRLRRPMGQGTMARMFDRKANQHS
jgi:hypothetical protein